MTKEKPKTVVVPLSGIGPLSFQVSPGMALTVRELSSPSKNRPTVGGSLKSKSYLVFNGITKVGSPDSESLEKSGQVVPQSCKVVEVNKDKQMILVEFEVK